MTDSPVASYEQGDCFKGLSESINEFCLLLYKKYISEENGNVFFSPFSIATCLAMVFAGARNETASQIRETLKLNLLGEDRDIHFAFQNLLDHLKQSISLTVILNTANRLYTEHKTKPLQEFLDVLENNFYSTMKSVNFESEVEKVRQEINCWIEEETKGKIKDLIGSGSLSAEARLVIVNAVYFSAEWKRKFFPSRTEQSVFRKTVNESILVDMMYQKTAFRNGKNSELSCRILELPYLGNQLSMFIILPDEIDGLETLERQLDVKLLSRLMGDLERCSLHVYLPKFKIQSNMDLKQLLIQLGMTDVFDSAKADLSKMTGDKSLYVSTALHRAVLDVNERGCEAAAVTLCKMLLSNWTTPVFRVDHPCLISIRENVSGLILFYGRLSCPSS